MRKTGKGRCHLIYGVLQAVFYQGCIYSTSECMCVVFDMLIRMMGMRLKGEIGGEVGCGGREICM